MQDQVSLEGIRTKYILTWDAGFVKCFLFLLSIDRGGEFNEE